MNREGLQFPLTVWLIITVVYGVALFAFKTYEYPSLIYHFALLALTLYCARTRAELGLQKGKIRYGVILILAFVGYLLLNIVLHGVGKFTLAFDEPTISLIIVAPVVEELFWRGLILQRMLKLPKADWTLACIINAALFAAMHIPKILFFGESTIYFLSILIVGVVFAFTFYASKSSYYSMIMHTLENIVTAL